MCIRAVADIRSPCNREIRSGRLADKLRHIRRQLVAFHLGKCSEENTIDLFKGMHHFQMGQKRNHLRNAAAHGFEEQDFSAEIRLKIRSGEQEYGGNNILVYEISHDGGFVHFQFVEFGVEAEHLRDRSDEARQVERENIAELKSQGKSVRQIAAILGISKSKVDRIIKDLPSVPSQEDAGQSGQEGQLGQPGLFDESKEEE